MPSRPESARTGRFRTISAKLNSILLLIVLATFLVAGAVLDNWLTSRMEERGIDSLTRTNQQVVDMVHAYSNVLEESTATLGNSFAASLPRAIEVDVYNPIRSGKVSLPSVIADGRVLNTDTDLVDHFTTATNAVATLFVLQGEDFFRANTSVRDAAGARMVGTALDRAHPAYAQLTAGKPYAGPAKLFGRNYMTHYTPLLTSSGKIIGATFVGIDFTHSLEDLKERVLSLKIGETGYSFVLDARAEPGMALIHPAAEGKNIIDVKDNDGVEVVRTMLEMKSGTLRYWWRNAELGEAAPHEKIAVVAPFDKWGWVVGTSSDLRYFTRDIESMRWFLALTGLVILLVLAAAILWCTHRWVSRPLSQAVAVTQKVANGDLTQKISASTNDEVGALLRALNDMSGRLREMIGEVDSGIGKLATNANQLVEASQVVSRSSGEQSEAANAMAHTVEEMSTSISAVSQHADACRTMAEHSGAVSNNGIRVIREAVDGMNTLATTVTESAGVVTHLGQESQQISLIVNVIGEIADQTNLLALNAAIEAARAGEAGRGFAVVADEVRKLAERTTLSTREITAMVERIQDGATQAVDSMQTGEQQVEEGVALANAASHQISEIKDGADKVSAAVIGISQALHEQSAANAQIARNVERIATQAVENHQQAIATADTAHGMEKLAEQLRASIARFRT